MRNACRKFWSSYKKIYLNFRPIKDVRVKRELEDTESVGFRHQFKGWDNVLNIDYSKSVDTVSNKELQVKSNTAKATADMSGKQTIFFFKIAVARNHKNVIIFQLSFYHVNKSTLKKTPSFWLKNGPKIWKV